MAKFELVLSAVCEDFSAGGLFDVEFSLSLMKMT